MSSKACDANDITVSNSRIDRLFCFWAMMLRILNLKSSNLIWASHALFNKDQRHLSRKQKHFYNTINLFIITLTIKNKNLTLTFSNFTSTSASIDLCQSQKNIFSKHSCLMITIVIFSKPIHITLTLPYLLPFTICKK